MPTEDDCSNHCPDEKGTERAFMDDRDSESTLVATIAPMKRGLKVANVQEGDPVYAVATIAPMKRGLKDRYGV